MTVADVIRAIRARWLLFTVCCIVPIAAAFAAAHASAPVYSATAELFVGPTRLAEGVNAYQNAFSATELAQQQTPSFVSLVDNPAVLRAVIADLHLATTPSQLSGQVSATSPLNSVLIDITASGGSAAAARDIANDTALRFAGLAERVSGSILGHVLAGRSGVGPSVVGPPLTLSLVKPALLPTAPSSSHKTSDLFLGLVVGLAVGLTAVILREKTDRRVRTVSQARLSTGCSFVTSIGDTRRRAGSLIRRTSAAESFRRLRLGLVPALACRHASEPGGNQLGAGRLRPRGRHQPCACPGGSRFHGATGGRRRARWPDRRSLRHERHARAYRHDQ